MKSTISAHEKPVGKILCEDYQFEVPGYQRPYAWGRDQAGELFQDLIDSLRRSLGDTSEAETYFLGSIVLTATDGPNGTRHLVIDGQQRLTTLTLLLAVLRDSFEGESSSHIARFIYEKGNPFLGHQPRYRLRLRSRDQSFFETYVQAEGSTAKLRACEQLLPQSQQRLKENCELLFERVTRLSDEERINLTKHIAQRCYLVVVSTTDRESAYRIFSVLNSRGLDLTPTDILKSEIIGGISDQEAYEKLWEETEESLGRDAFVELFGHIRMVYRRAKPQATLIKEFRDHVPYSDKPEKQIDSVIIPMADAFAAIKGGLFESSPGAHSANRYLAWLNRMDFQDWIPPALLYAQMHRTNTNRMERFFKDLERIAFFHALTRCYVNARIERYSAITKFVSEGQDIGSNISPTRLSEDEFNDLMAAVNGPIYETLSPRIRITLLMKLDSLLSDGAATYDHDRVSIEHVLPQNSAPRSQWREWIPSSADRDYWVHRVANLVLLSRKKNSSASNHEFTRKKAAYFTNNGVSPFPLTTSVLMVDSWTSEQLAARQERLIGVLGSYFLQPAIETGCEAP